MHMEGGMRMLSRLEALLHLYQLRVSSLLLLVRPAWLVLHHFKEGEESKSQRNMDTGDFKGRWDWTDWKYAHAETGISRLCVQTERASKMLRRECQAHCPGCNLSCLVTSTRNVSKFTSDHTI